MSQKLNQLFSLPFIKSYSTGTKRFITLNKTQTFLGTNFYARLNSIYINLVQALAKRDYKYIETSFDQHLGNKIKKQLVSIDENRFKLKLNSPISKVVPPRKKALNNILALRERIWSNGITRIGVQCNVYFGQKFDIEDPLKNNEDMKSKVIRVGQFRYLRYYPQLGLIGNIKNLYQEQTYELLVKYSSRMHLKVQSFDESSRIMASQGGEQNQIMTEMVVRTGNQKFDWVIVDVNNLRNKIY